MQEVSAPPAGRPGEGHDGVVVDRPERLLAPGLLDRGAERAERVVDPGEVTELGKLDQ